MTEVWKPIRGYEGKYEVSNQGRIKRLQRIDKNGKNSTMLRLEKIMNPGRVRNGYLQLRLTISQITKAYYVHVLVATNFDLPKGLNCTQVNHINGITSDNRLCNLEWVSRRENLCHRWLLRNTSSKYPGVSYSKLGKKFESYIQVNKKKFHLGVFDTEEEAHNARVNFELNNNIINKYNGKNEISI